MTETVVNIPKENGKEHICVIGMGRFGRAFAKLADESGEYVVHVASRSMTPEDVATECPNAVFYSNYRDAISKAAIVVLAVPTTNITKIISQLRYSLEGKIVVDVSNTPSLKKVQDHDLSYILTLIESYPDIKFVKCFNTISAYAMEHYHYPVGFRGVAYACGNDEEANQKVLKLANDIGIPCRILGRAEKASIVENLAHTYFENWRSSLLITLILTLFFYVYTVVWVCMLSIANWAKFSTIFAAVFGSVALNIAAIVYIPGSIAQFIVYSGYDQSKPVFLPKWLISWMYIREELGLLSFFFVALHFVIIAVLARPIDLALISLNGVTSFTVLYELGLFAATIAFGLGLILSILAIPGLAQYVSWRESSFLQRFLGLGYLLFGTAHVTLRYGSSWKAGSPLYFKGVPPVSLIGVCLPYLCIFMKIIALLYIGIIKLKSKRRKTVKSYRLHRRSNSNSSVKSWWGVV